MSQAWIALIGTLFGGAGLKLVEYIFGRRARREDSGLRLRTELRTDLTALRREADELRKEADDLRDDLDKWRSMYYSLVSSISRGDVQEALRKISEGK